MAKYKLKFWLLIVAAFFSQFCFADNIDSLQQLILNAHDLERKIELHTLLAKEYQVVDLTEARKNIDKALNLSTTSGIDLYMAEIYGQYGDVAVIEDSLYRAKYYYEIALAYFEEMEDFQGATGVTFVLGNIALTHDDLPVAMMYYLKTVDHAKVSGLESWLPSIYINIGSIYHKSGSFKEAQEYFTKSIENIDKYNKTTLYNEVYNNIGVTYMEMGEYKIAEEYFHESIKESLKMGTNVRAAKATQHLAQVYQRQGDHAKSIETLLEAEALLEKGNPSYAGPRQPLWAENYFLLGANYFLQKNYSEAYKNLTKGLRLSKKSGQLKLSSEAMKYLSAYWEQHNNADSALAYFKMFKVYQDSLSTKDNIRQLAFQEAQFRHDEEQLIEEREREKEDASNRLYFIIAFAIIVTLVLLIALLSLFLKLGRNKLRQGELEQNTLRKELELRNKELTTHLVYQVKNNEFILNISNKLKDLLRKATPDNRSLVNELIKEIEFDSSNDQWEEFEVRFQQVHTDFYKNLGQAYPDLSSKELRLCAFLRLNMNTKDICAITYQSTNSVTVARWRLRQKFGLQKEESLSAFLTKF